MLFLLLLSWNTWDILNLCISIGKVSHNYFQTYIVFYSSCLENPMDRGTWRATVHGVAKSWTRLRDWAHTQHFILLIFIGAYLLYNTVLISTVRQSESASYLHIAPLFWISFPFRFPRNTEFPKVCSWFSFTIIFETLPLRQPGYMCLYIKWPMEAIFLRPK